MLEVIIDLDWADERYAFVKEVTNYRIPKQRPALELEMSNGVKITGCVINLRKFAAQIIAACDENYPLEVEAAS